MKKNLDWKIIRKMQIKFVVKVSIQLQERYAETSQPHTDLINFIAFLVDCYSSEQQFQFLNGLSSLVPHQ